MILSDEVFGGAAVRAVADEDEFGGHFGADDGENLNDVGEVLNGAEIGEVHEDGFAVGSPLGGEAFVCCAIVEIAVHKVGNDFDGALYVEFFDSLVEQMVGNGGEASTLLEDKAGERGIAGVASDGGK